MAVRNGLRASGGERSSGTAPSRRRLTARRWLFGALGVAAVVLAWTVASQTVHAAAGISRLASPLAVAQALGHYVTDGFGADLVSSLKVFAGGWLVGGASAAVVGLLLGRVTIVGQLLLPIIEAIRPVSSIAWLPLSIVWFGLGYVSKAFVVGLAVFLVVVVYAVDGSARIPSDVERTATMLGMSPLARFRHVVLPGTLGEVLVGFRVSLVAGWGTVIVAELIAANTGLGQHLITSEQSYDIPAVMATMVCFAFTGFVLSALFSLLHNRLVPWQRARGR